MIATPDSAKPKPSRSRVKVQVEQTERTPEVQRMYDAFMVGTRVRPGTYFQGNLAPSRKGAMQRKEQNPQKAKAHRRAKTRVQKQSRNANRRG